MSLLSRFILVLSVLMAAGPAHTAEFEKPPAVKASKVLGPAVNGAGYVAASPVPSDGYLRVYTLKTPWGPLTVSGDQMLKMRIKELAALTALEKTTDTEEFGDALVKAGLSPVHYAGKLVTKPIDTVKNTVSGVGHLFGGIASGVRNVGKSQDDAVASITGAAKQRRFISYQYGIDPYTDYKPLKDKLDKLSGAAAVGGLAVTAAFIAIPGAAGTIISNVSTAGTLSETVRDNSASQLMDINRKKLAKAGIHADLVEEMLTNRHYTPVDMTAIADAFVRMGKLHHVDLMAARVTEADSRDVAYFIRRRIELTAGYQLRSGELIGFVAFGDSPFPMSTTIKNGLVGVFPIDILSWTPDTSATVKRLTEGAKDAHITGPKVLHITGAATPLAKKNLAALGWTLEENSSY